MSVIFKAASLFSPVEDHKWFIVNQSDEKERSASQLVLGSVHPITIIYVYKDTRNFKPSFMPNTNCDSCDISDEKMRK